MRRLLAAAALVAALLLLGAAPASAHAVLEASTPGDGARLDTPPERVRLEFNEPVSADLGGLRVFSADGDRVDVGETRADGEVVAVDLQDDLADGAYVATYRVVSDDGHPVQGGLVFSVGDVEADPALISQFFDEGSDRAWEIAGAVFRFLAYAGALLAAGGAFFLAFVHDRGPEEDRLRRLVRRAAGVGAVGILAALPIQAALGTGQGFGAITQDGVLGDVLQEGVGLATFLGLLGLVLLVLGETSRAVIGAGVLLAAGSFALSGHTRSTDYELLAVSAAIVHTVTAAVWFGGLVLLAAVLWGRRDEEDHTSSAGMVGRFSRVATVCVVAVGAAGVALSWSEVRALRALTSTTYGWTLLAKVGVVLVVGLIGAHNRFRVVPAIQRSPSATRAWSLLRKSVRLEAAALVVAIALTAVLVNVTPARSAAGIGEIFSETVALGDAGSVNIVVDPNQAGRNAIHLSVSDADGRPAEIADDVSVSLSLPSDDIGPIVREPFRAGPAHFQIDGNELVTGGRWTIQVTADISRFESATGEVEVLVGG
ncbi:MAG: copper resistance protein CopC [Acidimicrobiales bacterium]